jgi:hypothetical protein
MKRAQRADGRRLSPLFIPGQDVLPHIVLRLSFVVFGQVCLQRLGEELIRGLSEVGEAI